MPLPAPTALPLQLLADRCVQCGLCLPQCPTYSLDRIEAESPRGRIALARALERGTLPATAGAERHLDQCLGCRRCEAVCPAGVEYGALLVAARAAQRERRKPGLRTRVVERLVARPTGLARLLGLYRRLFTLLPPPLRPLPRPPRAVTTRFDVGTETALFIGCLARSYEPSVRGALLRLCHAAGVPVSAPDAQSCCGAIYAHAGDTTTAARLEATNRAAFAGIRTVLTLATGCHDQVRRALEPAIDTADALDFLAMRGGALAFKPRRERVALHLPCTQRNVVRSDAATRALLDRVPDLDVVLLDAGHGCCGAAGTQVLEDPARASAFRRPLLDQLAASGATRLLSANLGCRLHFASGTRLPVQHPLEFLAECLA